MNTKGVTTVQSTSRMEVSLPDGYFISEDRNNVFLHGPRGKVGTYPAGVAGDMLYRDALAAVADAKKDARGEKK